MAFIIRKASHENMDEHVFCVMYDQTLETGQDGTRDGSVPPRFCAHHLVGLMNQVYMECASETW